MLLGRTASGLYWMSRYIERAENTARIVDVGLRMALTRSQDAGSDWSSVVVSSGVEEGFRSKHAACTVDSVADYLLRDRSNPSSVLLCFERARENARMVRTALTREVWEGVNEAWMIVKRVLAEPVRAAELTEIIDTIKRQSVLILGTFSGTMLRNEIFNFIRIGTYIERADNTARILDVKYHLLLPSVAHVGTSLDFYQWESLLRSVAAHRSYRWVYDAQYRPLNVADFLILNQRMPRSLRFCYEGVSENLQQLAAGHGASHPCHRVAAAMLKRLAGSSVDCLFRGGLHEFLTDFIADNNRLSAEIAGCYNFD
ncbi:alpha-E domain-containing protein [Paraburkholderia sp. J12]|uniref:alpha-E domain-containing protein n=1 Tax=Paraburkholderia sp. J12 TaxID=2805432 RepID=UPI002ABE1828|nr:alpha-E domain-containing protein [Paraburkholderia sp. J12]